MTTVTNKRFHKQRKTTRRRCFPTRARPAPHVPSMRATGMLPTGPERLTADLEPVAAVGSKPVVFFLFFLLLLWQQPRFDPRRSFPRNAQYGRWSWLH